MDAEPQKSPKSSTCARCSARRAPAPGAAIVSIACAGTDSRGTESRHRSRPSSFHSARSPRRRTRLRSRRRRPRCSRSRCASSWDAWAVPLLKIPGVGTVTTARLRAHREPLPAPERIRVRELHRHRARRDRQRRQAAPPALSQRRPNAQLGHPYCRRHPGPDTQQRRLRLPPAEDGRGQDIARGDALPQTASREATLAHDARRSAREAGYAVG